MNSVLVIKWNCRKTQQMQSLSYYNRRNRFRLKRDSGDILFYLAETELILLYQYGIQNFLKIAKDENIKFFRIINNKLFTLLFNK